MADAADKRGDPYDGGFLHGIDKRQAVRLVGINTVGVDGAADGDGADGGSERSMLFTGTTSTGSIVLKVLTNTGTSLAVDLLKSESEEPPPVQPNSMKARTKNNMMMSDAFISEQLTIERRKNRNFS